MIVLQPHPDWNQQDAALTKQFFASPTWAKIIAMALIARPKIEVTSLEHAGMSGIRREAHEDAINSLAQIPMFGAGTPDQPFRQVDVSDANFTSEPING